MKSVVFNEIGSAVEFKPEQNFEEYLKLVEQDVKAEFGNKQFATRTCPACQNKDTNTAFEKFGFTYVECSQCKTVYMQKQPDDLQIKKHYLESASSRFWEDNLTRVTDAKRQEKIYSPRLQWILNMTGQYRPSVKTIADINSKNRNYIHALTENPDMGSKVLINSYFDLKKNGIAYDKLRLVPDLNGAGELKNTLDVISLFEVIDRTNDVEGLIKTAADLLAPGGLCFVTTISISGFDLQVLWGESRSIFPMDRINVFSTAGLKSLFARHGLEMLEFSTPGLLDVDIINSAVKRNKDIEIPRFVRSLLETGDEQLYQDLQEFLQVHRLSSFVRIALRKPV
ncbi:MAG: class I SAM-dependent methyltransferase [Candidatus Margulisiibacteriota bacterium]